MNLTSSRLHICLLTVLAVSGLAFADRSHDRTELGHNINIRPGEQVTDATCFGCTIRVRGHLSGDATTFGGSIIVEDGGKVDGDATTFAGNIRLAESTAVSGDVTVFGGEVRRDASATIGGDVTDFRGHALMLVIFVVPFVVFGLFVAGLVWLIRRLLRPAPAAV